MEKQDITNYITLLRNSRLGLLIIMSLNNYITNTYTNKTLNCIFIHAIMCLGSFVT